MLNIRTTNAIGFFSLLAACASVSVTAAEQYWCKTAGSPAGFSNEIIEGAQCRLVEQKGSAKTKAEKKAPTKQKATSSKKNVRKRSQKGFPTVSEDEQSKLDIDRSKILQDELRNERESRNHYQYIKNISSQASLDPLLKELINNQIITHDRNIKALNQEIANQQ